MSRTVCRADHADRTFTTVPIATWQDAARLLDRDSDADERHWGKLPLDQHFEVLLSKGRVKGPLSSISELRHRLLQAVGDAEIELLNAEARRKDGPNVRRRHGSAVKALTALDAAITAFREEFEHSTYHPLLLPPPDDNDIEEYEPHQLDLDLESASDDLLRRAKAVVPRIARLRALLDCYAAEQTPASKRPELLRTQLVRHLAPVWKDLTGRPPGRAGDPYRTGKVSPFHAFCDSCVRTLHPLVEFGALHHAVRQAVELAKARRRRAE